MRVDSHKPAFESWLHLLLSCVTVGKFLNISEPKSSHLHTGGGHACLAVGLLMESLALEERTALSTLPHLHAASQIRELPFGLDFLFSLYFILSFGSALSNCICRFCRGRSGAEKNKAGGKGTYFSRELEGHGSVYQGTIYPAQDF